MVRRSVVNSPFLSTIVSSNLRKRDLLRRGLLGSLRFLYSFYCVFPKQLVTFALMKSVEQIQESFETYLQSLDFSREPDELYAPIRYVLSLGGKRASYPFQSP